MQTQNLEESKFPQPEQLDQPDLLLTIERAERKFADYFMRASKNENSLCPTKASESHRGLIFDMV